MFMWLYILSYFQKMHSVQSMGCYESHGDQSSGYGASNGAPNSNQTTEGGASHVAPNSDQCIGHGASHGAPSSDKSSGHGASHGAPMSNQTTKGGASCQGTGHGASHGAPSSDQSRGNGASHGAPFPFQFPARDIRLLDPEEKTSKGKAVLPCKHLVLMDEVFNHLWHPTKGTGFREGRIVKRGCASYFKLMGDCIRCKDEAPKKTSSKVKVRFFENSIPGLEWAEEEEDLAKPNFEPWEKRERGGRLEEVFHWKVTNKQEHIHKEETAKATNQELKKPKVSCDGKTNYCKDLIDKTIRKILLSSYIPKDGKLKKCVHKGNQTDSKTSWKGPRQAPCEEPQKRKLKSHKLNKSVDMKAEVSTPGYGGRPNTAPSSQNSGGGASYGAPATVDVGDLKPKDAMNFGKLPTRSCEDCEDCTTEKVHFCQNTVEGRKNQKEGKMKKEELKKGENDKHLKKSNNNGKVIQEELVKAGVETNPGPPTYKDILMQGSKKMADEMLEAAGRCGMSVTLDSLIPGDGDCFSNSVLAQLKRK